MGPSVRDSGREPLLERFGLLADPDHEPVPSQNPVNGSPGHLDPSASKDRMDPPCPRSRGPPPQLEDGIGEIAMDPIKAPVRTAKVGPEPLDVFLSVVSTLAPESALGHSADLTDIECERTPGSKRCLTACRGRRAPPRPTGPLPRAGYVPCQSTANPAREKYGYGARTRLLRR